jgi:hypothetical protein
LFFVFVGKNAFFSSACVVVRCIGFIVNGYYRVAGVADTVGYLPGQRQWALPRADTRKIHHRQSADYPVVQGHVHRKKTMEQNVQENKMTIFFFVVMPNS